MLDAIIANKREEVRARAAKVPIAFVRRRAQLARPVRLFRQALTSPGLTLIAEVKQRSPSCGAFRVEFDPIGLARSYAANGAGAVSVLADETYFGTGPEIVNRIAVDPTLTLPVLWKDFVVCEYQVYEARAAGADAILLIARGLHRRQLRDWLDLANHLELAPLVETFTAAEAELALGAGADIIGVNTRDLATFRVNRKSATAVRRTIPAGVVTVSESGVDSPSAMAEASDAGFDAVLVGETLLRAPDPGHRLRELLAFSAIASHGEET